MGRDDRPWERAPDDPPVIDEGASIALGLVFSVIFIASNLAIGGVEGFAIGAAVGIGAIGLGTALLMRSGRAARRRQLPPLEAISIDRMLQRHSGEVLLAIDPPNGTEWTAADVDILESRLSDYLTFATTGQIVHHLGRKAAGRPLLVAVAGREPRDEAVRELLRRTARVYEGSDVPLMTLDGTLRPIG